MECITKRFRAAYETLPCTSLELSRRRAREVPLGICWRVEPCPIHKIAGINMLLQVGWREYGAAGYVAVMVVDYSFCTLLA